LEFTASTSPPPYFLTVPSITPLCPVIVYFPSVPIPLVTPCLFILTGSASRPPPFFSKSRETPIPPHLSGVFCESLAIEVQILVQLFQASTPFPFSCPLYIARQSLWLINSSHPPPTATELHSLFPCNETYLFPPPLSPCIAKFQAPFSMQFDYPLVPNLFDGTGCGRCCAPLKARLDFPLRSPVLRTSHDSISYEIPSPHPPLARCAISKGQRCVTFLTRSTI